VSDNRRVSNLEPDPVETSSAAEVTLAHRADVLTGREVALGRYTTVTRLLPHTNRRTIGAWCFLDHFGPDALYNTPGMQVPPHPHCGLQTVTWLLDGEVLHRDSIGTLATIRPGQLNLMTAAHGIAHSEESPDGRPPVLHGLQLWVALPVAEAAATARFEHYAELPRVTIGSAEVIAVIGSYGGVTSPARVHTPIVGADVSIPAGGSAVLPLRDDFEYGILAASGSARIDGTVLEPGSLLYLGDGRSTLPIEAAEATRLFLVGGEPFADELVMWWNFVARSHEEIVRARADWMAADARFGTVHGYAGSRLPAPELPSVRLKPRGRAGKGGAGR
jgi:redox-sensitive bicupin YhaK (pirin superfamily)